MSTSVRWTCLFMGVLLLLGGCGATTREDHSPPRQNRDLLLGKWEADDENQFVQRCEFAADQSCHLTIWHSKAPIDGTYSWSGPATLTVEYRPSEEAKKAYASSLLAFRDEIKARAKNSPYNASQILQSAKYYADEIPEREELSIGLGERTERTPATLMLSTTKGLNYRFRKPE